MSMSMFTLPDEQVEDAPRTVSRGAKLQTGFLGIDSLYLVLEYPYQDVYQLWASKVTDTHDPRLFSGIPFEDFVIRRGGLGYKLSVWDGDARLFITDRVDEVLDGSDSQGLGMGMMLQLGPKWLREWGDKAFPIKLKENIVAQLAFFGVSNAKAYPARINRIDITLDVIGLNVADFSLDDWRGQWVGHAKRKEFYDSPLTGNLEGLAIGSSSGTVRFKVYDKVLESRKRNSTRFWHSVWGISEEDNLPVARFEWSIKAYAGKFAGLRYLADLTEDNFLELLNYASLRWGRLCLPEDSNKTRRPLSPLWTAIRQLIDEETNGFSSTAFRVYDFRPDMKRSYLNSLAGWIAGCMARLGVEWRLDGPSSVADAINLLSEEGFSLPTKAVEKWDVYSKLVGGDKNE